MITMGYVMEPMFSRVLPLIVNRSVCGSGRYKASVAERGLQFPQIDPVWPYAEAIINTSLCITIFFLITPLASKLLFYLAGCFTFRYLYLAITWCSVSTERHISSMTL